MWKDGQVSWGEHQDISQLCRDGVRKTKAYLELNLTRDVRNNKTHSYRYISSDNKQGEGLTTQQIFALVFTIIFFNLLNRFTSRQELGEDQVHGNMRSLNVCESMGPDKVHHIALESWNGWVYSLPCCSKHHAAWSCLLVLVGAWIFFFVCKWAQAVFQVSSWHLPLQTPISNHTSPGM